MNCENCGNEHEGTYGSGRFCSSKCARGFSTKEKRSLINEKVRNKLSKNFCIKCGNKIGHCRKTKMCKKCLHLDISYRSQMSLLLKGKIGGYKENSGRGLKTWYISPIAGKVFLQSSWELAYAKYLDLNNIIWERNMKRFYYTDLLGNSRYYIPDFYLAEDDLYIEIKGFKTSNDDLKWRTIKNLKVLYKEDLQNLNIL